MTKDASDSQANGSGLTGELGSKVLPPPLNPPFPIPLTTLPSSPCHYLPDRMATSRAFRTDRLPGEIYHRLMDTGFRRSGNIFYQPVCDTCRKCVPIRIPVGRFTPNKSQRRCRQRNADVVVSISVPTLTDEKYLLYQQYLANWHHREGEDGRASMQSFLYDSPVDSIEFCYRDAKGKLLAVGLADVCASSLSSVYFYFDPGEKQRGMGTFGALHEMDWAKAAGIPYYYLGFWIDGCPKMQYKSNFASAEIMTSDGQWRSHKTVLENAK